jgi:cob(I)alamin adenosyltransferase
MKIYTKTGDDGKTGLFGGARVDKDDDRVEAYGTVDETNALLGIARAAAGSSEIASWLEQIQSELFALGAELASVEDRVASLGMPRIGLSHIEHLEGLMDQMDARLEPLKNFVLPGGTPAAAALHHARTVARRAERRVLRLSKQHPVSRELLVYLNRLSDFLFMLARYENSGAKAPDIVWQPRAR